MEHHRNTDDACRSDYRNTEIRLKTTWAVTLKEGMRAGSLVASIADYAEMSAREGRSGEEVFKEAIQNGCLERGGEGLRQVEEHYKREAGYQRADNVRLRLEDGLQSSRFGEVADRIISGWLGGVPKAAMPKDAGIDDGPALCL